ncbi:DUF2231 domain-containing protein [Fodinibius halophilus]|uniref:DUF2231 domain-containing protein n=1 Tax=Fodinibius halophilus TaxID=1736908 RepID=A0A6M1TJ32_9BACT|nr:DUF2231 domain-containing protein [Fodinibius halophilus]NGP88620.1 DUF2231 domain-containing protein [Fodinibius halophilus]
MWQSIKKGQLLGHPIHLMLVHFPTALFTSALILNLLGLFVQNSLLHKTSFYVVLFGLAGGVLAAFFGFLDYAKLGDSPKVFKIATWHGGVQLLVLMLFIVVAGIQYRAYPDIRAPGLLQLGLMGLGVGLLITGNYLGGELVLSYKVGLDESRDG